MLSIYALQLENYPILLLFGIWALFHLKDVVVDGFMNARKAKIAKKEAKQAAEEAKEEVKEETAEDILKPKSEEEDPK